MKPMTEELVLSSVDDIFGSEGCMMITVKGFENYIRELKSLNGILE